MIHIRKMKLELEELAFKTLASTPFRYRQHLYQYARAWIADHYSSIKIAELKISKELFWIKFIRGSMLFTLSVDKDYKLKWEEIDLGRVS